MSEAPKVIHAWGSHGPDSVTGRWSGNTFYDETAIAYVRRDAPELVALVEALHCTRDRLHSAGHYSYASFCDDAIAAFEALINGA